MCNTKSYARGLNEYYIALLDITDEELIANRSNNEAQIQEKNKKIEKIKRYRIKIQNAYKECSESRKFEIERYWGRSTYFSVFLGAILVAVGGVVSWETDKITDLWLEAKTIKSIALFILTYVGTLLSLVWFYVGKGSKEWQEVYEMRMYYLENYVTGRFHKIFSVPNEVEDEGNQEYPNHLFSLKEYPYSVSKLNLIVSLTAFIIWGLLWIASSFDLFYLTNQPLEIQIDNQNLVLVIILFIGVVYRIYKDNLQITEYLHPFPVILILLSPIIFIIIITSCCLKLTIITFAIGSCLAWLLQIRRQTLSFIIDFIKQDNVRVLGVDNHKFAYEGELNNDVKSFDYFGFLCNLYASIIYIGFFVFLIVSLYNGLSNERDKSNVTEIIVSEHTNKLLQTDTICLERTSQYIIKKPKKQLINKENTPE